MGILNTILDLLFPSYCLACQRRGYYLCEVCLRSFPPAERETESWIYPIFDYRHPPVRQAISLLKYKNKRKIADILAEAIYDHLIEELAELSTMRNFNSAILIPIPIEKSRLKERGFNQSILIGKALTKLDQNQNFILNSDILIKVKDTDHQARLKNRKNRLQNIVGVFSINPNIDIKNKNIILLDDVTTTGATLAEAKRVLKLAGARKIIAFTVAH